MNHILDQLVDGIKDGNILALIIIASAALAFNFKKIVEFIEARQRATSKKLSEALKCEHISGPTKSHLEEALATEHFNLATGMRLEKEFREAVILAHKKAQGELSFSHFKQALPHLVYKDEKLMVNITLYNLVEYWLNFFFGMFLALLGLPTMLLSIGLLVALPGRTKEVEVAQAIYVLGVGGFCIALALFTLSQRFPVQAARKVAKELDKQHNNSAQPPAA